MPRAARIRSNSGIYHIIMRGINRQRVFEDEEDYERYLWSLKNYKAQCGFNLYAWCLIQDEAVHRITDEQVRKLLRENFDCENVSQVQLLTEEKKILAIQLLLGSGASIRQVSRLTGISFGIVRKYT